MAKKKEKKKLDPEEKRFRGLLVVIVLIVIGSFVYGVNLIQDASYLGVLVMIAGLGAAIALLVVNMKRFKVYERLKTHAEQSQIKENERLDEDMVKTRDRIAALDARAGESAKGGE